MASITETANLAATYIGAARITSIDDDRFVARTLKAVWDVERRAAIRDGAWNSFSRRAELSAAADVVAGSIHPWRYRFPLPPEALRLISVDRLAADDWQTEGGALLCDSLGPIRVRFAVDDPEPANWDATFVVAFARRLALTCGRRIAGSNFDEQTAMVAYRQAITAARRVDARENPFLEQGESSWIEARWAGGAAHYGPPPLPPLGYPT